MWYISHGSIFLAKMSDMTISYLDITRELQCSKVCFANSCVISLTTIFCFACYPHGTRVSLDSWDSVLWQNKYWSCSFSPNIPPKYSRYKIERDYFGENACGQSTLIIKPAVLEKKKKIRPLALLHLIAYITILLEQKQKASCF